MFEIYIIVKTNLKDLRFKVIDVHQLDFNLQECALSLLLTEWLELISVNCHVFEK